MKKFFAILLTVFVVALCGVAFVACGGNNGDDNDNWGSVQEPKLTVTVIDYNNQSRNLYSFEENPTHINVNAGQRTGYEFLGLVDANGIQYVDAGGNVAVSLTDGMTLYESWQEIGFGDVYTIKFNVGGYAQSVPSDIKVTVGDPVTDFPVLTAQTGWEFVGWFSQPNGGGTQYSDGNNLDEKYTTFHIYDYTAENSIVTLYAFYAVDMVEYTFYNGAQELTYLAKAFEYNQDITGKLPVLKDTATQVFLGWSIYSYDTSGDYIVTGGKAVADTVLYAVFRTKVNITFYERVEGEPVVKGYADGDTVTLPEPDDYPGYAFMGWYDNPQFSRMPITRVTVYEGNTYTYYARWEETSYNITFEGEATDNIADIRYYYGDNDALPEPERAGYVFAGWSFVPQNEMDADDETFFKIFEDMYGDKTLYAVWEAEVYTIYFDPNGGDAVATAGAVTYGENYTLTPAERTGYTFLGWFSQAEGGTQYTDEHGRSLDLWEETEGRTLYAQWTINTYTVRYETDGGTTIRSQKYEHGEKIELPATPIKTGVYFAGWFSDSEFTQEVSSSALVLSDMTLYARWVESIAISSADDLKAIAQDTTANYHLTRDINLNGEVWTPIPDFSGILNGNGFKIYNFTMSNVNEQRYGFFATNHGEIRDVKLSDFSYTSVTNDNQQRETMVGVLVGVNHYKIINCKVYDGELSVNISFTGGTGTPAPLLSAGGLVGVNSSSETLSGIIIDCSVNLEISYTSTLHNNITYGWYNETLTNSQYVGGLCGKNNAQILNSETIVVINALPATTRVSTSKTVLYVEIGGIIGINNGESYENCANAIINFNNSNKGDHNYYPRIGALIARNYGAVEQCKSEGEININVKTLESIVGGLIGSNQEKTLVENSYSDVTIKLKANVNNSRLAGLVGSNFGSVSNCFSMGEINTEGYTTSSKYEVGGLVGYVWSTGSVSNCLSHTDIISGQNSILGAVVGVNEGSVRNCYYSSENVFTVKGEVLAELSNTLGESVKENELLSSEFFVQTLFLSSSVWTFTEGALPELNWIAALSVK